MSEQSVLTNRFKKIYWTVGLAVVCIAGAAPWLMTKVIETAPGYNTVVVNAPLIGEYSYEKEVLKPGRSLIWLFSFGIAVKIDAETALVASEPVQSEDGKPVIIQGKVRIRITDPYVLISTFGENWYKDEAQPMIAKSLQSYVGNHDMALLEQALKGPQRSSPEVQLSIQKAFDDRGLPIEVEFAAPDYIENVRGARYVVDANAKKWVRNPNYDH
jgi:regulator of protease activity HflC (stomatin/prohibitin superfamily)